MFFFSVAFPAGRTRFSVLIQRVHFRETILHRFVRETRVQLGTV